MSKSVEEVRRGLFEAKFYRPGLKYLRTEEERASLWEGYNAALDAVEIKLPAPIGDDHGGCIHDAATHDSAVSECRAAIEQTGLGLRVL